MSDSDSDSVPDLVESSDEDVPKKPKNKSGGDYAKSWLKKPRRFLEKQEQFIKVAALGPFLMGINNFLPNPWMVALHKAGLLLNNKREKSLSVLDWEEWSMVDVVETVVMVMQTKLRREAYLSACLDVVRFVDSQKEIVVETVLIEARKSPLVVKLWGKCTKNQACARLDKESKFAVIYVAKIYSLLVINFVDESGDLGEKFKQNLCSKTGGTDPEKLKDTGNHHYQRQNFLKAVEFYTKAAEADLLNHIYFGNRAQAYNRLRRYAEALADGRRAVTLKPDWCKGYYRYAQAFYELDKLDLAIAVNRRGLRICKNLKGRNNQDNNLTELEQQGRRLQKDREYKLQEERVRKILEDPSVANQYLEEELPSEIRNLPNKKRTIQFSINVLGNDNPPNVADVPDLISSDSSSEDEEEVVEINRQKQEKLIKEAATSKTKSGKDSTISADKASKIASKENQKPASSNQNQNNQNDNTNNNAKLTKAQSKKKKKSEKSESPLPATGNKESMSKKESKPLENSSIEAAEFTVMLDEGQEEMSKELYKCAMVKYSRALELAEAHPVELLGIKDEEDLVSIKYAYGIAAVSTGMYKHILDGIDKFTDIITNFKDTRFPLAYYGLAKAYCVLKRFPQAIEPLKQGIRMMETFSNKVLTWPGTNKKIEESVPGKLKTLLKEMLKESQYPPTPDAVCRYHDSKEDDRTVIYFSDPDFKGFTRIVCQAHCVIDFHNSCWRVYKLKFGNKTTDKDILDKPCPTPDCGMFIIKITIYRQDASEKEIESEKIYNSHDIAKKKGPAKTPASSSDRLQKKQEKREVRKQKKKQHKEDTDDHMEQADHATESKEHTPVEDKKVPDTWKPEVEIQQAVKLNTVLKKEEEEEKLQKYKGTKQKSKSKKKKEKSAKPQTIKLDINFTDEHEKQLLTEHSALDESMDKNGYAGKRDFSVPRELQKKIERFEDDIKKKESKKHSDLGHDQITMNLFSLFEDMLEAHGPLHVEDARISSLIEDFPQDAKDKISSAGGLSRFLRQSLKFAMIDNIVCLLKDAVKAREISTEFQNERKGLKTETFKSAPKPLSNPWKSVPDGKTYNKTLEEFPSLKNAPVLQQTAKPKNSLSLDTIGRSTLTSEISGLTSFGRSTPSGSGISGLDSFEENIPKKGTMSGLDDINMGFDKHKNKMDNLDDFQVYTKVKKKKEVKKKGFIDDIDSLSDSEPESLNEGSIVSDRESVSSGSKSNVGQMSKVKSVDAMTLSRSSSKSDVSDLSDMLKSSSRSSVSSPLVSRDRSGCMGSPILDTIQQPLPLKIPPSLASRSHGNATVEEATIQQMQKVDSELVNTLATEVVDHLYQGKDVSMEEKSKAFRKVSKDIWSDFERSGSIVTTGVNTQGTTSKSKFAGSGMDFSAIDQGRHKMADADLYMKAYYQKNLLEPYKKPITTGPSVSPTNVTSFPSIHTSDPPPSLSNPVAASGAFPSVYSNDALPFPKSDPSLSFPLPTPGNIWSTNDASSIPSALNFEKSYAVPPPPVKLPEKPSFSSLSIGTSLSSNESPYRAGYSSALLRSHQSVQTEVKTCEKDTLTDPYEPYKDDLQRMKEERTFLESQIKLAQKQIQELSEIINDRDRRNQAVEIEYKNRLQLFDKEKVVLENEKKLYSQELERVNLENKKKNAAEAEHQKIVLSYKEKLLELQKKQNEERKNSKQQMNEVLELKKSQEESQKCFNEEQKRATNAEIEVLNVKMMNAVQMLERSQKEFLFYQRNLAGMIKKFEEENRKVTPNMQQSLDHYCHISKKCEETIIRIKGEFEKQIQQIKNGAKLCDLQQVFVPPPPPPPQLPPMMMADAQIPSLGNVASLSSLASGTAGKFAESSTTLQPSSVPTTTSVATTQAPPKPLGLPAGLQQPKPLSLPQRSYLGPNVMHQAPHQGRNSFEKLISTLEAAFPKYNRAIFTQLIQKLRTSRGGSLSGMTLDEIVAQVTALIQEHERKQALQTNSSMPVETPKPSWSSAATAGLAKGGITQSSEVFEEEEDPCVICHEEMTPPTTVKLECNHRFHDECIRKWLREQSTCPNCRIYALLPDEFPSLT